MFPKPLPGCKLVHEVVGLFPNPKRFGPLFSCRLTLGLGSPIWEALLCAPNDEGHAEEPNSCGTHFFSCHLADLCKHSRPLCRGGGWGRGEEAQPHPPNPGTVSKRRRESYAGFVARNRVSQSAGLMALSISMCNQLGLPSYEPALSSFVKILTPFLPSPREQR